MKQENMNSKQNLGVIAAHPVEQYGRFTSRWAIPRVDPREEQKLNRKRWKIKNLVLLFFIYFYKQTKKFLSHGDKSHNNW
jgi:hypothetical protein